MPGWVTHLEAAKVAARRLLRDDLSPTLPIGAQVARDLGAIAHKWRNYYSLGAIGPDLFFLLPDFPSPWGNPLLTGADWVIRTWEAIDELVVGPWEDWMGPVEANNSDLAAQLLGGLNVQLGQALDNMSSALLDALLGLASQMTELFGLSSGVPRGQSESLFFWSDMFHYRATFEFPRTMWQMAEATLARVAEDEAAVAAAGREPTEAEAAEFASRRCDGEAQKAFALGWMTHCAVDVTGHAFTNAKCGGPFRLHWQRHHLVENHMDAEVYRAGYGHLSRYNEIGTSGLHMRVAFVPGVGGPYSGRSDAPMYDFFEGFPAYTLGTSAAAARERRELFNVDPGRFPAHLASFIQDAMATVYPDNPKILTDAPAYAVGGSGRPNDDAFQVLWEIFFRYFRHVSTDGFSVPPPVPPSLIEDHPFPTPPGPSGVADGRGVDPGEDVNDRDVEFTLFDMLLSVFAWIVYIGQVIVWLATVLPSLIVDVATFPAREVLYYSVVAPTYSMYLAARRMLVQAGFLVPLASEIDPGLTTLGRRSSFSSGGLAADLADAVGFARRVRVVDEPSGRPSEFSEFGDDLAFPRLSRRDTAATVSDAVKPLPFLSGASRDGLYHSHFVSPWTYPDVNLAGERIGNEPERTHPGPWVTGMSARDLFLRVPTDREAARLLDAARSPAETDATVAGLLVQNRHLGSPVEFSLWTISQLIEPGTSIADYNLDADRGYAYHCWDWDRHVAATTPKPHSETDYHVYYGEVTGRSDGSTAFDFEQPCVVPQHFDPAMATEDGRERHPADNHYYDAPIASLKLHYLRPGDTPAEPCDASDELRASAPFEARFARLSDEKGDGRARR